MSILTTLGTLLLSVPTAATQDRELHVREDMPPGPPWKLHYREARREALRKGTPIFVFVTKTY